MKTPRNRQEKIEFLKGVLSGKKSIQELHNKKVQVYYSIAPNHDILYDKEGNLVTDHLKEPGVIMVNVVCTETNTRIKIPHNFRDPIKQHQINL